jgi:ABC-type nitrate/sulfonate/bicarbonate transport system substrate-binding protein
VPDYYELVLITREDLAAKDPELLRKFLRAMVAGQTFVQQHTDKAVEILHNVSPDLSREFLTASLNAILPLMEFPGGPFHQEEAKWSEMINFLVASDLLKKPISPSSAFTNQYLPQ